MTADTVGGVWNYSVDLIQDLEPFGVQVTLYTQGKRLSADQEATVAGLDNCSVYPTAHALEWMPEPWESVDRSSEELKELASRVQPDLIHFNDYSHAGLEWHVPTIVVGHSCVYSWFDAVKGTSPGSEWAEYWQRVSRGLANAGTIVAPSRAMLQALNKHYGPLETGRVIYNGRRRESYRAAAKKDIVLAAGRIWDEAKNISMLAEAARDINWPVHVAGANESPADGWSLDLENVQLLGELPQEHMRTAMAEASIFAAPARYEPFGLAALEAALSGCALVLGDIPSLREIWGDAAIFVRPDDPGAISEAINNLIRYPNLRNLYSKKASARAQRYSAERQASAYHGLYASVLSAGNARAVDLVS